MLSRLFSNHLKIIKIKDRRLLNLILKILQSAKNQTGIFFHLKIAQLYIIMYFYVI